MIEGDVLFQLVEPVSSLKMAGVCRDRVVASPRFGLFFFWDCSCSLRCIYLHPGLYLYSGLLVSWDFLGYARSCSTFLSTWDFRLRFRFRFVFGPFFPRTFGL